VAFDGAELPPDASPERIREALRHQGSALSALDETAIGALERVTAGNLRLLADFEPGYFDGDVLFVEANGDPDAPPGTAAAWAPHIGGELRVLHVGSTHQQMLRQEALEEYAPAFADYLHARSESSQALLR
jgi:thioesterase domain-containing protein